MEWKFWISLKYLQLTTKEKSIRDRFLDWKCNVWKYTAIATKLKKKLRTEEEMDILETEEEKLSKQNLRQAIKAKENVWGIFPSAATDRTGSVYWKNCLLKWRLEWYVESSSPKAGSGLHGLKMLIPLVILGLSWQIVSTFQWEACWLTSVSPE